MNRPCSIVYDIIKSSQVAIGKHRSQAMLWFPGNVSFGVLSDVTAHLSSDLQPPPPWSASPVTRCVGRFNRRMPTLYRLQLS